ncbi:MAG: alpha/beta hydrolase [Saprospiraceae bacterium]|nr:alpha/beta hydrolase [Saprospiraceae bacterium]
MLRHIFILICLIYAGSAYSQKRFVLVDGVQIRINTIGLEDRKKGQPVVVFESGHGTPMDNWDKVLQGISELAPLVTYDRPGIGESPAIDEMPTIKNVADRLVKILAHLKLPPPFILVGHSLGGLYVRGFANYHPELLAGLIIIDPADFTETLKNRRDYYEVLGWENAKIDSLIQVFIDIRKERADQAPASIKRESEVLEEQRKKEFAEIKALDLPNIPVHFIMGGRFDMPEKFRSKEYNDEILFRSKIKHRLLRWTDVIQSVDKGMLFYSADAGHFVHYDDPELLISSVKIVLHDYNILKNGDED